jgi:hypothetical protein
MSSRKKGMDVPTVVVTLVLAIILLLVLLSIINGTIPGVKKINNCGDRGGRCVTKAYGVGCGANSYPQTDLKGCTEAEMCCLPTEKQPGQVQTQFTVKEQAAIKNGVIVTLGTNPTPLADRATVALKVGQEYTFTVTVNSKLPTDKLGPDPLQCLVYITDSRDKNQVYARDSSGNLATTNSLSFLECTPGTTFPVRYTPDPLDAFKSLILNVYLFNGSATSRDYSNRVLWLNEKYISLRVEPVIKFSGMSTEWTAKDDITITCNGISCNKIGLKLLRLPEGETTTYEALLKTCIAGGNDYHYSLDYISGTTVQTSGIPLNIDIGGFRLPYQQKVLYVTSTSPIAVVNNKATVTIDKATMIRTFGAGATLTDSSPLLGDKTYLCVEATTTSTGKYYALSDTPLRVDAFPPVIDADAGIRVVYPDPITATNLTTPYYYRQYPRIVVEGCYDFGQSGGPSGCTNYDYYIKTGNFINLNSNTGDWQTGLVGLLLTEGVNSLITYFASKDAANTICPLMTSNGYTRNTNPEIRFMGAGQAIVCIRIGDKVGNTRLVWKPIWSPAEMFNRILVSSLT